MLRRRLWIDLANSPHVAIFGGLSGELVAQGWEVVLTARDHAQTLELARRRWRNVAAIGSESPSGRWEKAIGILRRAERLRRFAQHVQPHAAISHGSYAQVLAARSLGIPAVTMMDYEHQPANHLSFRLAKRVLVPEVFPENALRAAGAPASKVVRYPGFKEELYLADVEAQEGLLDEFDLDPSKVLVVMRTPPEGALYHRGLSGRFNELLEAAASREGVVVVLLPRFRGEERRYQGMPNVVIPRRPVDGPALLAVADLVIGGGGTMSREAAILGTPAYTVFAGRLAAVDAELIRRGRLHDLRAPGVLPVFVKKTVAPDVALDADRLRAIRRLVVQTLEDVA